MINHHSRRDPLNFPKSIGLFSSSSFSRNLTVSLILVVILISGITIPLADFFLDSILPASDQIPSDVILAVIVVTLAGCVTLTFSVSFFLRRYLNSPLDDLAEIVRAFDSDNYPINVPTVRYAEFQPIANLLADMGKKINTQMVELEKAEAKYRAIFERATEGIFQTNSQGQLSSANPALAQILGYNSPDELITSIGDIAHQLLFHPERCQEFSDLIQSGQAALGFETQVYCKDGSVIWALVHAHPVLDEHNNLLYVEGTVTDVTARKMVEEELHTSRQHLEELVEQRTAELVQTNRRLLVEINERKHAEEALRQAHMELEQRIAERTAELGQTNEQLYAEIMERKRAQVAARQLSISLERRVTDRTRELSALYGVSSVASRAENLETLLDKSLSLTLSAMRSGGGAILLVDESGDDKFTRLQVAAQQGNPLYRMPHTSVLLSQDGIASTVFRQRETMLIPNISTDPRVHEVMQQAGPMTLVLAPLKAEGKVLGIIGMMRNAEQAYTVEEVALLTTVADQIGISVQRIHLRELAQQNNLLEERQRLARDMHDSVTQYLYGLVTLTEATQGHLEANDVASVRRMLDRIGQTARQALKEMRLFIHQLRPSVLEKEGLIGALQYRLMAVEGRSDVRTRILADDPIRLPRLVENALYQIAQEALNNILRHACAESVIIRFNSEGESIVLEISDDGCGFDPDKVEAGGMGLQGMRELAEKVGGTLAITSEPFGGTQVKVTVKV